jgi:hypothetical protein
MVIGHDEVKLEKKKIVTVFFVIFFHIKCTGGIDKNKL